jgi:hypothetical protein
MNEIEEQEEESKIIDEETIVQSYYGGRNQVSKVTSEARIASAKQGQQSFFTPAYDQGASGPRNESALN